MDVKCTFMDHMDTMLSSGDLPSRIWLALQLNGICVESRRYVQQSCFWRNVIASCTHRLTYIQWKVFAGWLNGTVASLREMHRKLVRSCSTYYQQRTLESYILNLEMFMNLLARANPLVMTVRQYASTMVYSNGTDDYYQSHSQAIQALTMWFTKLDVVTRWLSHLTTQRGDMVPLSPTSLNVFMFYDSTLCRAHPHIPMVTRRATMRYGYHRLSKDATVAYKKIVQELHTLEPSELWDR